jgi:hypothetical protein
VVLRWEDGFEHEEERLEPGGYGGVMWVRLLHLLYDPRVVKGG